MPELSQKLEGAIFGLLIGDALGVPYEFHGPHCLPPSQEIEYKPPVGFDRAHHGVPPGTWSDDGAQALCLLASLLHCQRFDANDFGQRLRSWYSSGYMAVDGHVFDVGVTTGAAIRAMNEGVPPLEAGPDDDYSNGNGALMRVLPLALWHIGSDVELVSDAHLQSQLTHGHLRSRACCALYCLWARRILQGSLDPWNEASETLSDIYQGNEEAESELKWHIRPDDDYPGKGSGYVVDCLRSARWAVENHTTFTEVVRAAIKLGNDTDTTACVAGGIAGLREGIEAIPSRWRHKLRSREMVTPLLEQLIEWRSQ